MVERKRIEFDGRIYESVRELSTALKIPYERTRQIIAGAGEDKDAVQSGIRAYKARRSFRKVCPGKQRGKKITYEGEKFTICELAEKLGLTEKYLKNEVLRAYGYDLDSAGYKAHRKNRKAEAVPEVPAPEAVAPAEAVPRQKCRFTLGALAYVDEETEEISCFGAFRQYFRLCQRAPGADGASGYADKVIARGVIEVFGAKCDILRFQWIDESPAPAEKSVKRFFSERFGLAVNFEGVLT